jgi:hypothetical protein
MPHGCLTLNHAWTAQMLIKVMDQSLFSNRCNLRNLWIALFELMTQQKLWAHFFECYTLVP